MPLRSLNAKPLVLLAIVLLAIVLFAQKQPAQAQPENSQEGLFSGNVEVRVVNVDVVATARDGTPVHDLTRDDFELLVDGEPVEIRFFQPPVDGVSNADGGTTGTPASPATADDDSGERLNLVVFLDRAYLAPGDGEEMLPVLQELLDRELGPSDRVMLVQADERVDILAELQRPPIQVAPLFEEDGFGRGQQIREKYDTVMAAINQQMEPESFKEDIRRQLDQTSRVVVQLIENYIAEANLDIERTIYNLQFLVSAVAALPGRNAVLYIGGRMPIAPGDSLIDAWRNAHETISARAEVERMKASRDPSNTEGSAQRFSTPSAFSFDAVRVSREPAKPPILFATLAREAAARGVTFFTIDTTSRLPTAWRSLRARAGGVDLRTPERWDFQSTQRLAHEEAMASLAEVTGGVAGIGDADAVSLALRGRRTAGYELGFLPPETSADEAPRAVRDIEVRLVPSRDTSKIRLRYRRHFRHRVPDVDVADRTISAVLMANGDFENPLKVAVELGEPRPLTETPGEVTGGEETGATVQLPLTVKVPIASLGLVAEEHAHRGQMSIFWTTGSFSDGVRPVTKAVIPVRIRNDNLLSAFGQNVEYALELDLPADARAAAISVRDDLAVELGTVAVPLTETMRQLEAPE